MEKKQKVLIVEDEKNIVDILRFNLRKEGYDTLEAFDGVTGLRLALEESPDLILLDLMLPEMNGFEVCKLLRDKGKNTPVLIITAREEEKDKILGLDLGADDYITKPFNPLELVARVKTQLRRYTRYNKADNEHNNTFAPTTEHNIRGLNISKSSHRVFLNNKELALTPLEFDILWYLCEHKGNVVSSEELFEAVWKEKYIDSNNTVMTHIARLREKLHEPARKPKYVKTVWGVGYTIDD